MSYPYLPVNPCCTDVVLNTPCGCSSIYTNGGCENPCGTHLTASSTIVYDGPALPCIVAEPCDTLNVILQKIDEIICNLLTQINILNIQIDNMTTQIINIEGDIINIYNQLGECCNATTTTTSTAAPVICESFSLTNTGVDPVAIIITDCYSDEQEAIILNPGDTNICVVTDSPLTVPATVIVIPNGPCGTTTTTSTSSSSTTTTSTTAYPCECLTFYNGSISSQEITYIDCNGVDQYHIILPDATNSYCGCCGQAPGSIDVTITIGANCINGECPAPTTTTTTTAEITTTTTSTTIVETCSCVDIIISQDDLDDATGNTLPFFDGKVNLYPDKNLTCEDGDLEAYYSVAGTYTHCLKGSVIPTIILQYVKDDNVITSVQSQIVNLDNPCLVDGECIPTTTSTTTTLAPCVNCISGDVIIGTQTWSKCNLNVDTYLNGDPIPEVTDPTAWVGLTTGAWCYNSNDSANGPIYGKLYNWFAVNDPRGLAPVGYHIPTNDEMTTLLDYIDPASIGGTVTPNNAGGPLKEIQFCHWETPNTAATDSTGFTALPGGFRENLFGVFGTPGELGIFWSATENDAPDAYAFQLLNTNSWAYKHDFDKNHGYSVRCIKDTEPTTTTTSSSTSTTTSTSSSTTTTTTTVEPTTTTTTTAFAGLCTCMDITIAQTDLDDATGNTTPGISNGAVYLTTTKGSSCNGTDIDRTYTSVAESESWCIKTASISTIQMFYYKNNVPVYLPAIDSTYTILYSACSVKGDCSPTTTTTTTTL